MNNESPPSKNRNHIFLVLTLILSATLTGRAVYFILNQQLSTSNANLQVQINSLKTHIAAQPTVPPETSPTISATPFVSKDLTAKNKVFFNYGISFNFPSNWNVSTMTSEQGTDISLSSTKKYTYEGEQLASAPIIIQVLPDTSSASIDTYLTGCLVSLRSIHQKNTVTLGEKTVHVLHGDTGLGYHDSTLVFTDGKVYWFNNSANLVASSSADRDSITQIFNKILSTVVFTK